MKKRKGAELVFEMVAQYILKNIENMEPGQIPRHTSGCTVLHL